MLYRDNGGRRGGGLGGCHETVWISGPKDLKTKEETIRSCWSNDPVHANLHTFFKLAINLIDYFKSSSESAATKTAGGKRPRSESVTDHNKDRSRKAKGGNYSSGSASKKKKGIPLGKQARRI